MRETPSTIDELTQAVLGVIQRSADFDYIGEAVSQLEHAIQCAWLASKAGARDEDILAALLHDVGHWIKPEAPQMEGLGVISHEDLGANWIRDMGFSETVARLVAGHVAAKRYLCFRNPVYWERLSEASRGTLQWQGGPMSSEEAASFEADPLFKRILALRSWDERAKDPDSQAPGLDHYASMIGTHLENQRSQRA